MFSEHLFQSHVLLQLHLAASDHISDSFANAMAPLSDVHMAVCTGEQDLIEERASAFIRHAQWLGKV